MTKQQQNAGFPSLFTYLYRHNERSIESSVPKHMYKSLVLNLKRKKKQFQNSGRPRGVDAETPPPWLCGVIVTYYDFVYIIRFIY